MTSFSLRFVPAVFLILLALSAAAQRSDLPDLGASSVLPTGQEYYLGRVWLMSFRRQAPIMEDPVIQEYLESLTYRLAETSELKDRRLEVVGIEHDSINAFAVPGGVVGVHMGLIKDAESEAQLASVLTHELAHLSQRHFSRGVEAQRANQIPMLAGMLAGMVAIVAGAGDVGMGAIASTQAAVQQNMLRFSRQNEQEADRIGIQNLARAGMDPGGASAMFEVMQREARLYGARPPEFLLTHPLTESRIADAKSRAAQYPKSVYADNPQFQLMRVRAELAFMNDDQAVARYREKLASKGRNAEAWQYGLALALTRKREFAEALALLKPLRSFYPDHVTYLLAETDAYIESGEFDDAERLLAQGLRLSPGNHPLTMELVKLHFRAGTYSAGEKLLAAHAQRRPNDPYVWYVLAEMQGLAGNTFGLHRARAEYFMLKGRMLEARSHFGYAIRHASDAVQVEKLRTRQAESEQMAKILGQL